MPATLKHASGIVLALLAGVASWSGTAGAVPATAASAAVAISSPAQRSEADALGKMMFFDPSLSGSGKMSCASCHSPANAFGPPNGLAVQLGGLHLDRQGARAVPSLSYVLNRTPVWTHVKAAALAERVEDSDNSPIGGFGWDGRFDHLRDQAMFPMFDPAEMANASVQAVADKLERAPYAARFKALFGANVFADPGKAVAAATSAIERYELDDPAFHPYTSKFDYYLDGKVQLTAQELRGMKLFDDPQRGNCASCHIDQPGVNGAHPLFTDYSFEALGVPRNHELRATGNPDYYDMGLCGPLRQDQAAKQHPEYCGLFKTPTLRNTATRHVFFHNGRFHTLKDALRFYVERDTDPGKWYSKDRHGKVVKFDDLPPAARIYVDTRDAPLTLKQGDKPFWNERDIDDVAAFLATLDDGYRIPSAK